MNTNNKKYKLALNLICVIVVLAMSLNVFASLSIANEINKPVIQEEIKTIDNIKTKEQSDSMADNVENDNPQEEIKRVYAPVDYYNSLPKIEEDNFSYERKIVIKKETKAYDKLSKFLNKVLQKMKLNENFVVQRLKNKIKGFEIFSNSYTITTIDCAPYYFIMPSIPNDYLKNIVFPKDIANIMELLPYSLTIQKNTIYKMDAPRKAVTSRGTTNMLVLMNAPSPKIEVLGKSHFAKLVIDIRNNTLYKYDKNGLPLKAYLVATGARGTRTYAGLRIVTYKERFPYAGDPTSKRALDPYSYGPYIIFMNVVNPKTGRQYVIEQLLHGNGSEYSIGKKVSHGCVRTNNSVMKYELSKEVKRGDYVLLINPDVY